MRNYVRNSPVKPGSMNYDGDLLLNDLKVLHDDTEKCMLDIEEDMSKLVLHNDKDFKVNNKLRLEKLTSENLRNKLKPPLSPVKKINKNEENFNEHIIRIDCTYAQETQNKCRESVLNSLTDDKLESLDNLTTRDEPNEKLKNNVEHNFQSQDLQTLLIMTSMSKSDDDAALKPKIGTPTPEVLTEKLTVTNKFLPIVANSDTADILNITPFRIEMNEKNKKVAIKFLEKWKAFVTKRKEILNKHRQECLNTFFDKVAKKKMDAKQSNDFVNKTKMLARDYSTYQQRYQVQKHIIALQKAKLEEQNRLIEELKYNRIIEASRQSVDAMKDEIRKTYFDIDRQLKPKIKCLTNELKLQQIEEPSLVLHCLKVPRFLQRMEKRAREREEKHAIIRERRRQMEEERVRLKQQVSTSI
ncbi:unnamed protein product [Diatraea saccharalis]|uniref:Uncharacterized protein n=1 Tax=Diatraea saccharalis TaxID=40085 RepID=A0A9N9WAN9_9NEOP|nr:unnamed protein product [Diatraea saccharalis]